MAEARKQRVYGEIVLAQPVRTQVIVLLILAIALAIGAWVTLGTYTRTETARGILVTDVASAKVVAIRAGVLTELFVREGDLVQAGQKLATVQIEQRGDTGGSAVGEGLGALEAQRGLADEQTRLAGERAGSERAKVAATLAGLGQQHADLGVQLKLQEETVASAKDLFERVQSVAEKGFVSKIEVERRHQAWIVARQDLARLQQQQNSAASERTRVSSEVARISADAGSQVNSARVSAQTIAQQQARLRAERGYTVSAPVSGRVTVLQAAVGRTVDATIPIMVLVPDGTKLHADIYAPTKAIGFVEAGQEVRLLYDAFPYQRFGSFTGRITRVSRSVIDPRELSAPLKIEEPVYRIEVEPEAQGVDAYGRATALQPGMTLTANIVLDRRSFLDWLLEPVNAVLRRNG